MLLDWGSFLKNECTVSKLEIHKRCWIAWDPQTFNQTNIESIRAKQLKPVRNENKYQRREKISLFKAYLAVNVPNAYLIFYDTNFSCW